MLITEQLPSLTANAVTVATGGPQCLLNFEPVSPLALSPEELSFDS